MDTKLDFLATADNNEIETVTLNNGLTINCKKMPLSNIEELNNFLGGVKELNHLTTSALEYIARSGNTKLYAPTGDISRYMRKSDGTILSSVTNNKGKLSSQAGFKEIDASVEGVKTASKFAKAIPYIGLAVLVIETGANIIHRHNALIEESNKKYDDIRISVENKIYELWEDANNSFLLADEAHRYSAINSFDLAIKDAKKYLRVIEADLSKNKKINDRAVYAYKSALDLLSISKILNISFTKVEDTKLLDKYINSALKELSDKNKYLNDIATKCYEQHIEKLETSNKVSNITQLKPLNKKGRVAAAILSVGLSEAVVAGSKYIDKQTKDNKELVISNLELVKNYHNPYINSLKTVSLLLEDKGMVLLDDKYLYYQV